MADDVADLLQVNPCIEPGEVELEDLDRLFGHHLHSFADDRKGEIAGILIHQGEEIGDGARNFSIFGNIKLRDEKRAVAAVDQPKGDAVFGNTVHQDWQGLDGITVKFEE